MDMKLMAVDVPHESPVTYEVTYHGRIWAEYTTCLPMARMTEQMHRLFPIGATVKLKQPHG